MLFALTLLLMASVASVASEAMEDPCSLPKVEGPCRAQTLRFHYNKDSGKCEAFLFGGCRGNANNYQTLKECYQICAFSYTRIPDVKVQVKTPHCLGRCIFQKTLQKFWM